MAKRITAIKAYAPRLKSYRATQLPTIVELIEQRTNLNASEIRFVIRELHEAILFFGCKGIPVKIDDLGTFTPAIRLDGHLHFNVLVDAALTRRLNYDFNGTILRRNNIGIRADDLIQQWNTNHPDDPVA
jgi:hypothetical protein